MLEWSDSSTGLRVAVGWVVQAARSADTFWYILNIVHFFWIPSFVICHLVIQFLQTFQVFSVFMFSYSVSSCFIVVVVLQHQNMCMTCVCHTCVCMYVEIYMYTQLHIHTCWGGQWGCVADKNGWNKSDLCAWEFINYVWHKWPLRLNVTYIV